MSKRELDYRELKEFYDSYEIKVHSLQVSNGLLSKKNNEYKNTIKILKKDLEELSYLLTELIKEKNESAGRNKKDN